MEAGIATASINGDLTEAVVLPVSVNQTGKTKKENKTHG
jgi:hypothetical protein